MIDMIGDAPLLSSGGFQRGVRSDARNKVLPQVSREFRKTSVTKNLSRPQDCGRIDVKALGHFPRREETGLVGGIEDRPNQSLAARVEFVSCFGKARVEGTRRSFAIIAIGTLKSLLSFFV